MYTYTPTQQIPPTHLLTPLTDVDESSKRDIKNLLIQYDRNLLVADDRRCEAKSFGGPSARTRKQKSYR